MIDEVRGQPILLHLLVSIFYALHSDIRNKSSKPEITKVPILFIAFL